VRQRDASRNTLISFDFPKLPGEGRGICRHPKETEIVRLALYQPDQPPNVGTILRLGACLGVAVDIVDPCGFPFSQRALRRAGLDYLDKVQLARHVDWDRFLTASAGRRLVLLTTAAVLPYTAFRFRPGDVLLLGSESGGVPPAVHERADARLRIPMRPGLRSLNVAMAAAMVLGEALRQTGGPEGATPEPADAASAAASDGGGAA